MALRNMLMPKNQMAVIEDTTEGRTYHCVDCGAQFNDKNKMEVHFISHNKVYRFLCGICGTGLKRKEHLDRHTLGHQEVRPHACPECGKCFKRKEHLNIHRAIHIGEKAHVCNLCDRSFYRKDHLQKHIQTHSKSFNVHEDFMPDQEFVEIKEEEFMDVKQEILDYDEDLSSEQNFIASMEVGGEEVEPMGSSQANGAGIPTKDRPHACDLCEKTYKRKDHLKMHSYTHTKKNKICTECGKAFHREEQLLNHMSTHMRSGLGDGLRDGEPYVEHNIGIMPIEDLLVPRPDYSDERPHACDICGRRFKRKQHLKVHASVHMRLQAPPSVSANSSVWCSNCGDGFEDNAQFMRHSCESAGAAAGDAKKENEPEYPPQYQAVYAQDYQTDYPPEFIDVSEAAPSATVATPSRNGATLAALAAERALPTPQKVFVCKYCSKPFKRKDHYKIHLNIHTGVRSFFCPDCGKGFYRKDHLQKHYIVHMKANSVKADGSPYLQRKAVPGLVPIKRLGKPVNAPVKPVKAPVKPEITITAPSAAKLRIPLQIKVPYQVVVAGAADQRPVTVHPQD